MTKDGWGTAWPDIQKDNLMGLSQAEALKVWPSHGPGVGWPDTSKLKKQGSNLVDSEGLLYFQCHGCEALHDPETKSFKTLHDTAHQQGWKIKWNASGQGYKIYCVKCRDSIECGEEAA